MVVEFFTFRKKKTQDDFRFFRTSWDKKIGLFVEPSPSPARLLSFTSRLNADLDHVLQALPGASFEIFLSFVRVSPSGDVSAVSVLPPDRALVDARARLTCKMFKKPTSPSIGTTTTVPRIAFLAADPLAQVETVYSNVQPLCVAAKSSRNIRQVGHPTLS